MVADQYLIYRNHRQPEENSNKLELFKNLLQPHFLFNSLNNLYALSLKRSEETPEAIAGLSCLLERVVSYSCRETIPLSEEIALIKEYIALEKIWLGECSFFMDFQVKGDTAGVTIPPLTIYTLIENAFKHGIRKCRNNCWVTIHLVVKDDKILLKVRNGTQQSEEDNQLSTVTNTGLGIKAVRKMLESSYRKHFHLNARPIGNVYAVDLIIDRVAA
ncbi:MAG: histidine kinase [Bacteroidales bacterium]|nr:histidine kinase [Bacteroidales bacterium]